METNNVITPLVSIICPAYNHEKFIAQCLDGFIMQITNFPFEILVHDDASTDSTKAILLDYEKNHPGRFKNIYQTENQFSKEALSVTKILLNAAKGKYIACCEGDDYWTDPNKLQKQVDFLEANSEYVMAFHDAMYVDEHNNIIQSSIMHENDKKDFSSIELIRVNGMIPTLSMCFRNVLDRYPKEMQEAQNGDAVLTSLLGHFGGAKFMSEIIPACYRKHSGGVWSVLENKKRYLSSRNTYRVLANYYRLNKVLYDHFMLHSNAYDKLILQSSIEGKDRRNSVKFLYKYCMNRNIKKDKKEMIMYFKAALKIIAGFKA